MAAGFAQVITGVALFTVSGRLFHLLLVVRRIGRIEIGSQDLVYSGIQYHPMAGEISKTLLTVEAAFSCVTLNAVHR